MLLPLRDFIQRSQQATPKQIAREFGIDIHALEPMLDFLVKKGLIARHQEKNCRTYCKLACQTNRTMYTSVHSSTPLKESQRN